MSKGLMRGSRGSFPWSQVQRAQGGSFPTRLRHSQAPHRPAGHRWGAEWGMGVRETWEKPAPGKGWGRGGA